MPPSNNDILAVSELLAVGLTHHQAGRLGEAEAIYRHVLQQQTENAEALHLLGVIAHQCGNHEVAIELIEFAIKINPNTAEFYNNCGEVKRALHKNEDAIDCFKKAISIRPYFFEAMNNMGLALHGIERNRDAIRCFETALSINPDYAGAHNNLGRSLQKEGQYTEAVCCYQKALSINPDYAEAHNNLGTVCYESGRYDAAIAHYQQALCARPGYADAYNDLGFAYHELGRYDEAVTCYEAALANKPDYAEAHYNLGIAYLLAGEFKRGWKQCEWRWGVGEFVAQKRPFSQPLWDGLSFKGRTLLIWSEQGVGDEIMYSSLIPHILAQGAKCIVECDPRLATWFQRSFADVKVVSKQTPPDPVVLCGGIDFQCPMGSLPQRFLPDLDGFGLIESGYLQAEESCTRKLRDRYQSLSSGLIVGISWWSGNKITGKFRTAPLALWEPVLTLPGIQFVNLQYGDHRKDIELVNQRLSIDVYHDEMITPLVNLDDFAAQVAAMDLVISIDNSTVHVAGSLGVPVWALLPCSPDWRWMLEREDSPWYPSVRLFRQEQFNSWDKVFASVAQALAGLTTSVSIAEST